jgi:hypothetical protein
MKTTTLFLTFLAATVLFAAGSTPARANSFDLSHSLLTEVLERHVRDDGNAVDYAGLQANPLPLKRYLDQLAAVPRPEFDRWPADDRLAFLLNLYNAATLQMIIDHYPVSGIKSIGGLFRNPWKQEVVHAFGRVLTLDEVEHDIIRKEYPDARIHFALVCAAKGCPPLRAEAFVGARLEKQLDEQGRIFLAQTGKNRWDARTRTLHLSPIFRWFSEDFEKHAGSVTAFVTGFLPEQDRRTLAAAGNVRIRYTNYDWSLNDVRR